MKPSTVVIILILVIPVENPTPKLIGLMVVQFMHEAVMSLFCLKNSKRNDSKHYMYNFIENIPSMNTMEKTFDETGRQAADRVFLTKFGKGGHGVL